MNMKDDLRISPNMTKKEIIEKYTSLLDAYEDAIQKAKEVEKWRSEAEKQKESIAIEETRDATVESVMQNIDKLKLHIRDTLNNLAEKLSSEAERLEQLKIAVAAQEKRLKELYDIEEFQDALEQLVTAYEERKIAAEEEYKNRSKELENEYNSRKEALLKEIEEMRASWEEEKKRFEKEFEEQKALAKKEWEREEAEYKYERDRKRRIEENEYKEKMEELEKELKLEREALEKEFAEREADLKAKESEYEELKRKVDEFPSLLQREVEKAAKEAELKIKAEMEHKIKIITTEYEWQKKMYEQKIAFLEEIVKSQEDKMAELKEEVDKALERVHQIAEKAVEWASQVKAYQSVKEIALEQAKKSSQGKEE